MTQRNFYSGARGGILIRGILYRRPKRAPNEIRRQYVKLGIRPGQHNITDVSGVNVPGSGPHGKVWFGILIGGTEYHTELLVADSGEMGLLAYDPGKERLYFRQVSEEDAAGGAPSEWTFTRIVVKPVAGAPAFGHLTGPAQVAKALGIQAFKVALRNLQGHFLPNGDGGVLEDALTHTATVIEHYGDMIGLGRVGKVASRTAKAYRWVMTDG